MVSYTGKTQICIQLLSPWLTFLLEINQLCTSDTCPQRFPWQHSEYNLHFPTSSTPVPTIIPSFLPVYILQYFTLHDLVSPLKEKFRGCPALLILFFDRDTTIYYRTQAQALFSFTLLCEQSIINALKIWLKKMWYLLFFCGRKK